MEDIGYEKYFFIPHTTYQNVFNIPTKKYQIMHKKNLTLIFFLELWRNRFDFNQTEDTSN